MTRREDQHACAEGCGRLIPQSQILCTACMTQGRDNVGASKWVVGETVRAFHPGRFGVVNEGTVVSVGRTYLRVDFGPMLGGTLRVRFADVVSL